MSGYSIPGAYGRDPYEEEGHLREMGAFVCDNCGAELEEGDAYYETDDLGCICEECFSDWAQ